VNVASRVEGVSPGVFDGLFGLFSRDIGIDLGTANTLVHVRGRGIVIAEPSVVAKDQRTGAVLAIGAEAKRMVGRTPASIVAVRPLKDGVISDFDITEQMLNYFIRKVHGERALLYPRPRVIVGIPSGVTEVEKRAVQDAAISAGARWARLVEEPMAAAIGAGLPVNEPTGSMIVDIGGGTTEVAVTSLGGIVISRSIRIGGDEMDSDIVQYARREFNLLMGERTAEDIKIAIGSAYPLDEEVSTYFRGRDLLTGLPRSIEVTSAQIREAIEPSIESIVDAIKATIEETPPELIADVMDQGIYLAGGGALLRGLDTRVAEATQMAVHVAEDPLTCVVRGCGMIVEDLVKYERSLVMDTYSSNPR
jgi:rod shape-determining protein MreB